MKSRALLVVALEQELPTTGLADWTILYTGVGKVNAAINLMAALTEKTRPADQLRHGGSNQNWPSGYC